MDESYRLTYRGEILNGQHPAVVKRRLSAALQLSEDQAQQLFSGSVVTIEGNADAATAARYRELFTRSGARLQVDTVNATANSEATKSMSAETKRRASTRSSDRMLNDDELQILPVGSDVLRPDERHEHTAAAIDVSHLAVQLGEPQPLDSPPPQRVRIPDFGIAEVGADIPNLPVDHTPAVDVAAIDFEVAEVGADIGAPRDRSNAEAPDVSRLRIKD